MYDEARVLANSSIRIGGSRTLYFDPYQVSEASHDADVILITHDHFDHFSLEDIRKVAGDETWIVMPESLRGMADKSGIRRQKFLIPRALDDKPGAGGESECEIGGVRIRAIPAYNRLKPFHPRGKGYAGYVVEMDGVTYYVAGDTDVTPENQKVRCDVALVPVGGKFTMDYKEAARLVNQIAPKLAIPTHYGDVAGSPEDGRRFVELLDKNVEGKIWL